MTKANDVIRFFNQIKDDTDSLETKAELLVQNMYDYLSLDEEVKYCVKPEKGDEYFHFYIKPFDLNVFSHGSYKLYELDRNITTYCYELKFFLKEKDKDVPVLNVYITADGYIVLDVSKSDSICDARNEFRGKRIFARILNSLCDSKKICL